MIRSTSRSIMCTKMWNFSLIKGPSTVLRPTNTGDLLVFYGEFVIISDLFVGLDVSFCIDYYLFLENLCITVWLQIITSALIRIMSLSYSYAA